MYKFDPILKSPLWGGEKIAPYKGLAPGRGPIGESWELSGVEGSVSVVAEGPDAGMTLTELLARDGEQLLGRRNYERFGTEFPLLVKFIDARQDLSIQVHPDDRLAWERHRAKGKTEMWYVVEADQGAHLRSGFARQTTPAEYERSVADGTIADLLADYAVRPGDVFYLPAGRIHSIGAGTFVAEIQQTSDITYRIYDFDRRDAAGNPRELHTALAKEAIDYTVLPDYRTRYEAAPNRLVELVACPYFTTALYTLTEPHEIDLAQSDSFLAVVCIRGSGTLTDDRGRTLPIRQGETVLVPASTRSLAVAPRTAVELLASRID